MAKTVASQNSKAFFFLRVLAYSFFKNSNYDNKKKVTVDIYFYTLFLIWSSNSMFLCLFARQLRLDGTSQADLQIRLSTVKLPLTFLFLFQSSISYNSFSCYFNRICRVQSGGTNVYEENYKNDNAANHEEHSYSTTSLGQLVS